MATEKELKLLLKAQGGAQAAAEVRAVEAATADLTAATNEAGKGQDGFSESSNLAREAIAKAREAIAAAKGDASENGGGFSSLFPTFQKAGAGAKALGEEVLAMAGGPMGVASIAVGFLVSKVWEEVQAMQAAKDAAEKAGDSLRKKAASATDTAGVVAKATTAERELVEAMQAEANALADAAQTHESRLRWIEKTAAAEDALKKAILERKVAEGSLTQGEAGAMGLEIDKAAINRRNQAAVAAAQAQFDAAVAAKEKAARAVGEIGDLTGAVGAAAGSGAAALAESARARQDELKYQQSVLFRDGISGAGIEAAFGGSKKLQDLLELSGPEGRTLNLSAMSEGKGVGDLLAGINPGAQLELADFLAKQAEAAGQAAEVAEKKAAEEKALKEQTIQELEKYREAARKIADQAEAEAIEAGRKLAETNRQKQIDDTFTIPAIDERQRAREAAAARNQTPVPEGLIENAQGILSMVDKDNQPFVAMMSQLIAALQNGTDAPELREWTARVQAQLEKGVGLSVGDRARLQNLNARLDALESRESAARGLE